MCFLTYTRDVEGVFFLTYSRAVGGCFLTYTRAVEGVFLTYTRVVAFLFVYLFVCLFLTYSHCCGCFSNLH